MAGRARAAIVAGGAKPMVRKPRKGGWTEAKKKRFLEELANSCNVTAALRKVKMGQPAAYKLRQRSAEFRAGWAQALSEGYAKLELVLLERAINGTVKTVVRGDGRAETIREYPNGMALSLLKMHRDTAASAEPHHDPEAIEEVRERIIKKLAIVRRRIEAGKR